MATLSHLEADWPTLSRRLDEALEIAPNARDSWLLGLPESDAIKRQLRQLLDDPAAAQTAALAATLPRLTLPPDANEAAAGTAVGPYQLVRALGSGGMGQVWLAERVDGALKRQVALKLPQQSWAGGFDERLRRERDILASLDHPHIARLYDAGVDALGRPYLALEYVEGESIDVHCQQQALSITQRLHLILQVARAVAHAHAQLVVHRDLKPANILVTAQGQVRLLDFGIAKLMEGELTRETQLTQHSGRALTLDYASPEQIRGEPIGTASDVYSLGVVAYELLARAKPYQLKRQSAAALEEAIASVDVRLASSAAALGDARALKGDLDAILNKALKKNVAERYPTVEALALDIERHLNKLPVLARPDALAYRLGKFLRRNSLVVAAVATVAVSLLAGMSVAIWQARVALAQADRAERVKTFALSIFDDADAATETGIARSGADMLRSARARVSAELGARPEVAVELMTAIGQSMVGQGLMPEAESLMREAVALSTQHFGSQHALTCDAVLGLGQAQVELGRNAAAIATLKPCVESARARGDPRALSFGLRWLSTAQFNASLLDEGVESARQAVAALSMSHEAGRAPTARDTMLAQHAYADALGQVDRPGAIGAARLALATAQGIYGDKIVPAVLAIRTTLALALVTEGQLAEGLTELDALVPATVALLGPRHPQVSKITHLVGITKLSAGDARGAISAFTQSMEVEDAIVGDNVGFDRGMARYFLGSAYSAAREHDVAVRWLNESETLLRAAAGPNNLRTLRTASAHALQLAEAGRLTDAEAKFSALEAATWTAPSRAGHQRRLSVLRSLQGRHDDALRLAESANEVLKNEPSRNLRARGLAALGFARLEAGQASAALQVLPEAVALFRQTQLGISPEHADTLVALGRTHLQLGDAGAAAPLLAAADASWLAFAPAHRHAGLAKLYLAQALWAQGDKPAATEVLRQAQALLAGSVFVSDRERLQSAQRGMAL